MPEARQLIARGEAREPHKMVQPFCGVIEAEPRDKSMRVTILFVLIPPPSPRTTVLGLGGGILYKGTNIAHGPGVYTPRYQLSPLRGLGDAVVSAEWPTGY